jgi:putative transcriptional regulator
MIRIELEKLLAGRTLYWLSQETGIRWPTLAAMATGKARRLDLQALDALCRALECQPGDLLVQVERRSTKKRATPAPKR